MIIKFLIGVIFVLIFSKNVYAYIDPGTGAAVIGSIWPIIIAILAGIAGFFIKIFIRPIKKFILYIIKWIKTNKKKVVIFIVLIIVILGVIKSMKRDISTENMYDKILVLGIDSLDPKIMIKLMEEGKLPNFEKLKELGAFSELQTTIPPETPVAWSAAATGSNPGKYGIFDFINRDPKNYMPKLNLANQKKNFGFECARKGTAFWEITSSNDIPTTVIRWPVTFPPTKIKGKMLSGLGVVDLKGLLNSYRFYTSEDYDINPKGAEKVIKVENENEINTELFGPFIKEKEKLTEVSIPMKIKLENNKAVIIIDDTEYKVNVNDWSDWIRVKFKVGFMKKVYGIFKVHLLSTEPNFNMYMTTVQIDPVNPVSDISYPSKYAKELAEEIGLYNTLGMPEDTKAVTENKIGKNIFVEQIKQIENEREKMFWYEFNRFKKGVFAFGFDAGDRLKHITWEDKLPKTIEDYYIDKDRFLGEVLGKISNTALIIFSDHGFSDFKRAVSINNWLVENGYMVLTDDIDGAGELFRYVDWSKTKAYSLGFTSLYINLDGRESKGIVKEKDELVNEIVEKLSKLTDPKNGKKVITKLYKKEEVYNGEFVNEAPDIIIGFEPGYRMSWQNAVGGLSPGILIDNDEEWSGDHLIDRSHVPGILFTNFKIKKENPDLMDIAPTILNLTKIKIPESMDGKSLI